MTRFLAVAALAIFFLFSTVPLDGAASEVSNAFNILPGTEAGFVQKFRPRGFQKDQTETGSVLFGTSPRMRWTYTRPESKIFIFDGTTSWLYVPGEKQVTVNRLSDGDRKALPFLLLGDGKTINQHYTVKESRSRSAVTVELVSRDASQPVRTITLVTSPKDHLIRKLEYRDKQGNRTTFEFSNHRKVKTSPAQFAFAPPAGVQIVSNN